MHTRNESKKLAQSASALGAALLGFGLGAGISNLLLLLLIIIGGIIHVAGMYVLQLKEGSAKTGSIAKMLWITAWICLLSLTALITYLLIK
ncbi:MAG: hypothetical protein EOO06_08740 [Chitinophagaceae bacterium]|nr:hypothetical protein [Flavisolibacter longurius]RYY48892.1 MAG: hypothetical protein EOO06_08740 [Chitinophagaceae bacterium]